MPRVKRGKTHLKRRKNLLKQAKGYRAGRKSIPRLAKVAVTKAGAHAKRDRKVRKRMFRRLWLVRLNAALKQRDEKLNYSRFIKALKDKKVEVDRKILSQIAQDHPKVFDAILKELSLI